MEAISAQRSTSANQTQRRVGALGAALMLAAGTLSACGQGSESEPTPSNEIFGYAVDENLQTTNAGSALGASTKAQLLAARIYPGPFTQGPKGQWIPNRDLAQGQLLPGVQQRATFKINEQAKYSDGAPVTCESFLLAYTAGVMPTLFHSFMPLMNEVERVECQPNARQVDVVFKKGYGPRWRQIFGAGTLLPAHAIAERAGMTLEELNVALSNQNWNSLVDVAQAWNEGFELNEFQSDLQVSSGPYKIRSVGDQGEVVLERNEFYAGEQAAEAELVLWPRDSDWAKLAKDKVLRVADSTSMKDFSWLDRDDPEQTMDVEQLEGVMTDTLLLSDSGVFANAENRRAFAACIDQASVAKASSEVSGVEVSPVATRTLRAGDPSAAHVTDISDPHLPANVDLAKVLGGTRVAIGYAAPDDRKKAMVQAMKRSCESAGIEIVDASEEGSGIEDLRWAGTNGNVMPNLDGTLDALLLAVDPVEDFGGSAKSKADIEGIRADERASWDEVLTVPLATQPRVIVHDRNVQNVVANSNASGVGWNMDRWSLAQQ
ncbi:ABC transporter substrate-binding protein [Corynebacterium gerontici]|uniref:Bacterial extracellular solute-binding proteins, family 5 Middle n=1 Tax=Corynebacterium gerontici TaxID=2079234 RepID=A0A3G6J0I2_9CORY|nr:ABC transporter substrate-binding protein [Corynebacterium gerontici]AZA11541.1 Bacterial extracellular solute-binding proteins, family 5 Middle [Corynebacterium gerontici]